MRCSTASIDLQLLRCAAVARSTTTNNSSLRPSLPRFSNTNNNNNNSRSKARSCARSSSCVSLAHHPGCVGYGCTLSARHYSASPSSHSLPRRHAHVAPVAAQGGADEAGDLASSSVAPSESRELASSSSNRNDRGNRGGGGASNDSQDSWCDSEGSSRVQTLAAPSVIREEGNWSWKENRGWAVPIHYVRYCPPHSSPNTDKHSSSAPAILFLHGFGMGTFQFETCCRLLAEKGYEAWCIDFLGQGSSFPESEEAWHGLGCSIENWYEMTADFIQGKIGRKVHLAGNSMGGFVALMVAAKSSSLCSGLMLLNATPFWGFNLSNWDGVFPAPKWVGMVGSTALRLLGNRRSVSSILDLVYVNKDLASENSTFVEDILAPARHPLAPAAFASILSAPESSQSYTEMIDSLPENLGVCLAYGKQDPWVVPLWGQRLKRQRPSTVYYEVDNAGHCPHHEEPQRVTTLLAEWVAHLEDGHALDKFTLEEYGFWQKDGMPGNTNVFEQIDYYIGKAKRVASSQN